MPNTIWRARHSHAPSVTRAAPRASAQEPAAKAANASAKAGGGDLFDFSSPVPDKHNSLDDLFGDSLPKQRQQPTSAIDDMLGVGVGSGAGRANGGNGGMSRVNGDDDVCNVVRKPKVVVNPTAEFKGQGTDRHALKAQFEAHVHEKAEAAVAAVRQAEEEKKHYEDAKFAAQVQREREE
jgi:hypothetical protein